VEYPRKRCRSIKAIYGRGKTKKWKLKRPRRMFLDEMDARTQKLIVDFFSDKKILIVSDILKGSDEFPAGWMMVVLKKKNENPEWVLKHINYVLNIFGSGDVRITDRGSLRIGKITMQRKGGDSGRETSKMLQFKINPVELFH